MTNTNSSYYYLIGASAVSSCEDLRMTTQRRIILEEIAKVDTHPAADEVYDRVRQRLPRISLGTVYRNLEILSEHGLIRKLDFGDGHKRFDQNPRAHYHVRCTRCGRVGDVFVEPVATIEDCIQEATDYDVKGHRLDFFGLCPECNNESSPHGDA